MTKKNIDQKLESILMIITIICSGLLIIIPLNPTIHTAFAVSTWTQTSDRDFTNGTMNNLTVVGSGDLAELRIDLSGLQTWTNKTPINKPIGRAGHAMASIYGTDKVLLFGGEDSTNLKYNDTWVYDLSENSWTQKSPVNKPSARVCHAMASIYGDDKVILFGGYKNVFSEIYDDTWVYDLSNDTWTKKMTTPVSRYSHAMASIYGDDKVILIGGNHIGMSFEYLNDTWVYDLSKDSWTQLQNNPIGRSRHAIATINGTDKVVLYGGWIGGSGINDTWVFDLSDNRWTQKNPADNPGKLNQHAMATICETKKILLFGGYLFSHNDDTWVYDLYNDNWTKRTPKIKPSVRRMHAMASIYGEDKVVMFGGFYYPGPNQYFRDNTWVYQDFLPSKNGTFVSTPYDTGYNSSFITINWYATTPENTSLKFQLKSAVNASSLSSKNFVGPDGTKTSHYNISASSIWPGHNVTRWVQYKVYFNISIFTDSPSLKDFTITFNCLPTTMVVSPINGSLLTYNTPTFKWTFKDHDSEHQKAFQVQIDNNINFEDVRFDSGKQITEKQGWEFPTGTNFTELPEGTWYWKVRTMDADDFWTDFSLPRALKIDTVIPSSAPTIPINNGFYNSLNMISGIATDKTDCSGLKKVEISIKRLNDIYYWNGGDWVPFTVWLTANGTEKWMYDSSAVKWTSGKRYHVQSRAIDNGTNVELPKSGNIFTIDMAYPTSIISIPTENTWLNNVFTLSGLSSDIGGSGTDKVKISIKCIKDYIEWDGDALENNYWNGRAWTSVESWLIATGTNQWSYNTSSIPWSTGNQYLICSRATDNAGNIELPDRGKTFEYDAIPPEQLSISINNGEMYTRTMDVILSLTSEDIGSGVFAMSFSIDGIDWSNWEPFNTTSSLDLLSGDGEKIVYFMVRDYAGNIAEPVFDNIILDTKPPKNLSIIINENAIYTNSTVVKLNLHGVDLLSGLSEMSCSFDSIDWQPWETFKHTKSIYIPAGDGNKKIHFKIKDTAGNIAEPVFDTIFLDTKPPNSLSIVINNGASETNSTKVRLVLSADDGSYSSGVSQASFSTDGAAWTSWEPFNQKRIIILPPNDGEISVYFRVIDHAGNIADPVFATILLNTTSPEEDLPPEMESSGLGTFFILSIIIIIVLVIMVIGIVIIIRRRKRYIQELLPPGVLGIKASRLLLPEISIEQIPAAPTVAQLLPTTTATPDESSAQQPLTTHTTVPQLASSTQISQPDASTSEPNTHATQLPALPPAQSQTSTLTTTPMIIPTQPEPRYIPTNTPTITQTPTPTVAVTKPTLVNPKQPHTVPKKPEADEK